MQVNMCLYTFIPVTYGQPPEDSCAPASLPSPSEIAPRWFSSFSHPPYSYEQKFNTATRLGHIKVETSMYYFAFPSCTFPQDQDHSNHPHSEGKLSIQDQTSSPAGRPQFAVSSAGSSASPGAALHPARARPRIPGALLPPGAAPPPHGPDRLRITRSPSGAAP